MGIIYIILMTILFIGYNMFFNKKAVADEHSGQYNRDFAPAFRGIISFVVYGACWIIYFNL